MRSFSLVTSHVRCSQVKLIEHSIVLHLHETSPCCQDYQYSTSVLSSLSVMTQAEPQLFYPKKISTQTRGETNSTFLSPAHSNQDLKSVQTGIFLKTLRRCESGLFPFKQPIVFFSVLFLYI